MATISDSLRDILYAGLGAVAITAEKGKEVIDILVEKGELSAEQGKQLNQELKHKAATTAQGIRDNAVETRMKFMTPEERDAFAVRVAEVAAEQNAADAAKAAEEAAAAAAAEAEEVVIEAEAVEVESVEGEEA